jgi:heptaprenylglyceryl phosphate synthase
VSENTAQPEMKMIVFNVGADGGGRCLVATAKVRAVVQLHDQKIRLQQLYAEVGGIYAEWQDIETVTEHYPGQIPSRTPA